MNFSWIFLVFFFGIRRRKFSFYFLTSLGISVLVADRENEFFRRFDRPRSTPSDVPQNKSVLRLR